MKHKVPHRGRFGGLSRPHVGKDTPASEKMQAPMPGDTDMDMEMGPNEPDADDASMGGMMGAAQGPSQFGKRFAR